MKITQPRLSNTGSYRNPEGLNITIFQSIYCGSYRNPEGLKYNHLLKYLLHLPISLLIVFKYLL